MEYGCTFIVKMVIPGWWDYSNLHGITEAEQVDVFLSPDIEVH
jgi:hypothetical protein